MPRKKIIPNGKPVTVYLSQTLIERLRKEAEQQGLTLSQYLRTLLTQTEKKEKCSVVFSREGELVKGRDKK